MRESSSREKLNNAGFSLVELLVVIAIMSTLTGMIAFSVSLMFSKDATRCATRLNDIVYEARMDALSKPGRYTVTVTNDGSHNLAMITCQTDSGSDTKEVNLDGEDSSARTQITATLDGTALTLPVSFEFDKSKGCIKTGVGSITQDGILCFDITALRGSNDSKVNIITTTGKHSIGDL